MKYHVLNRYIGHEIFIVGVDGDLEQGEIACFYSLAELNAHLSDLSPVSENNLIVAHGVLTQAEFIPQDVGRGAFIVVADPSDAAGGFILTVEDCHIERIASMIENLFEDLDGPYDELAIDNVFVMYGYELDLRFCINEDGVDEEMLDSCEEVAAKAEEIRKRNMEGES